MPREPKGKQQELAEEEMESSGEASGESVADTAIKHSSIPGFSAVQVHGINNMTNQMTTMMTAKIDSQDRRFGAK